MASGACNCGEIRFEINDESQTFIPAGTITKGGEDLEVKHHFYVDSKAPRDEIGDDGQCHREGFKN